MNPLSDVDSAVGLRLPIHGAGGDITAEALRAAAGFVGRSGHGPYRLQVLGHTMWRMAGAPENTIDTRAVEQSLPLAGSAVARSICVPAWQELSESAQPYLAAAGGGQLSPGELSERVAERTGLSARRTASIRHRLVLAGYLEQRPDGSVGLTDLVPPAVIRREAPEEHDHYAAASAPEGAAPASVSAYGGSLCREWMPRARAHCILPAGHSGRRRSRL